MNNYISKTLTVAAALLSLAACSDIDDMKPEGSCITDEQINHTVSVIPERMAASISGMYNYMGSQFAGIPSDERDDDFGYPTAAISADLNGADMVCDNSGFNWFSTASDYSDRTPNFGNPYIRYAIFYNQIKMANDILSSIVLNDGTSAEMRHYVGQAYAVRAFDYLNLAPYFQFGPTIAPNELCVPLVTEATTEFTNNPRATVAQVYAKIVADLTKAIELLSDFDRGSDKTKINAQVAHGLRARAYLAMGEWQKAYDDATAALTGYTPASREEVSKPFLCNLNESNWMWGILIEADKMGNGNGVYSSWCSHLASFPAVGYTTEVGCYKRINPLLWNKIADTDIRKQWWVDEELKSTLLDNLSWDGHSGRELALYECDTKVAFVPYTNVKFGMKSGVASTFGDNDWCLMRAEEMILIQAESKGMLSVAEGQAILQKFVQGYRDPAYTCTAASAKDFQNECWKQRRIELWGEGFAMIDINRLHKPVVRIHGNNTGIWPDAFAFNIKADDPYLLMRFSQSEMNTNAGIVNNTGGIAPKTGQDKDITDGVTDY